jgi:hypothetical protein
MVHHLPMRGSAYGSLDLDSCYSQHAHDHQQRQQQQQGMWEHLGAVAAASTAATKASLCNAMPRGGMPGGPATNTAGTLAAAAAADSLFNWQQAERAKQQMMNCYAVAAAAAAATAQLQQWQHLHSAIEQQHKAYLGGESFHSHTTSAGALPGAEFTGYTGYPPSGLSCHPGSSSLGGLNMHGVPQQGHMTGAATSSGPPAVMAAAAALQEQQQLQQQLALMSLHQQGVGNDCYMPPISSAAVAAAATAASLPPLLKPGCVPAELQAGSLGFTSSGFEAIASQPFVGSCTNDVRSSHAAATSLGLSPHLHHQLGLGPFGSFDMGSSNGADGTAGLLGQGGSGSLLLEFMLMQQQEGRVGGCADDWAQLQVGA